jgi:chaperonin GroEL (HSP60 family)
MAQKQIMFEDSALLELKAGVDQLAEAVTGTMGPSGRKPRPPAARRQQGRRGRL